MWPSDVAATYGLSTHWSAAGETVALIALGGGYLMSDLAHACDAMGVAVPVVVERTAGAANGFGGGFPDADDEIALDMQVLAGVARGATLAIYFAPNSLQGLTDAVRMAAADGRHRDGQLLLVRRAAGTRQDSRHWPETRIAMTAGRPDYGFGIPFRIVG